MIKHCAGLECCNWFVAKRNAKTCSIECATERTYSRVREYHRRPEFREQQREYRRRPEVLKAIGGAYAKVADLIPPGCRLIDHATGPQVQAILDELADVL